MGPETAPEIEASEEKDVAEVPTGNTRRGILVGAGLLGVVGVAAACGGGDDEGGDSAGGSGAGGALAQTSEIPVGGGKIFKDQKVVLTQPAQGDFKGFEIKCTHRGCDVTSIQGTNIVCACHNSMFSITDGSVTGGPAEDPLPSKQITVSGTSITLA